MSKEDLTVVQGSKKFNKELADVIGVKTFYCNECKVWHVGINGIKWDPEELKMSIPDLKKLLEEGKSKAPKDEIENMVKFHDALRVRRLL